MAPPILHYCAAIAVLFFCVGAWASPLLEGQGPLLEVEPPARLEFANSTGGRLDCVARGSPRPMIKWLVTDGGPAATVPGLRHQAPNGSLLFPPFGAAEFRPDVHRAVYRCHASNALGRVLSRDARVRAVVIQAFRVETIGASVMRGNSAVLRCQVPPHVREFVTVTSWLQDRNFNIYPSSDGDGKLHMLPSGELVVRGASEEDAASRFQCRVTHRLSGETRTSEDSAELTVTEPRAASAPRFPQRLLSVEARRDELVVLPCIAQAHPPPDYRWESEGEPLAGDEQRYEAGGLLVLARARPAHSGRYACVASNPLGRVRLEVSLLVTAPLGARVQPPLLTAALGQPATFACAAAGHPLVDLHWLKDGQPVRGGSAGGPAHTLSLHAVAKDDEGMYQCFVKNDNDMAQGTAELRLGDTPPTLIYSFIRQTIQPGPSVSLKCVASGNPTPQIKWNLDGFKLPQNDRFVIGQYVPTNGDVVSHVNITNVRVEDGGTYQCTAVNRAGEMSHSAELNVYGLPRVRPMGDVSAIAGETLSITCPAAGYPIDGIEWFRVSDDGDRVLPYITRQLTFPNGTLMIEKVQSGEDDGLYRCTASNKQGDRASDVAHVTVTVPPKITPFSFRSDLHLGERVGAQCVVSKGDPPLRVHWLKDGRQLSPVDGERGVMVRTLDEFTSVLSIGALSRHHGGNYTCVARNGAAQTAESALLSVNVPPAITPFAFGELSSGERVLVTCSVKRGDPPLTIQWFKDARPIPPTPSLHDDPDLTVQGAGEYSSVLAIRSVSSKHSGNYTCSATNKARTTTYTALLLVTVPPSWIVEPRSGYAKIGGQALLHCKAEGFPPPTIVWKRIPPSRAGERPKEVEVINVRAGALLLPNGTLFLKNVTKDDEGRYICEATNGIGVGLSAVLYLTVNAPVQFKMRSRKEMVRRGTTAILSCHAVGDVPITFVWRKEGSFLELQGRTSAKNVANGLESELRINAVNSDDGGIYTCFARNEYGHDQTEIHLVVQDAPDHPTNVRLVDKGSRRVTIAWTPPLDGNSPITRYVVRHNFVIGSHSPFSRNVDFPSDLDVLQGPGVETSVEGTQSTAVISPLSPATTYSIQVVAENTLGPGTPSHEILVRTDEEAPSGGPLHLSVDALSSTQLILNWDPPALDQWNGPLLGHYVGYRYIGDMENKKQYNFTTVNFKGNGKEEARLGGLKKYSKYGLVVQAFNSRGPGPLSEEIQGHTLEDVPEAPPRDVRCSALSSESVQVSWQPPPEPLVHGVIQGYRLIYEPILPPTENEMMQSRTKTTTALTTTLHNLFKYTNYSIELIAFTRVGDGAKSHPLYCRTSEDVPGAPSDIKSVLITNKMTLIAWLPPKQPNGVITKYNIYVRVLEDGRQVDARSVPHTSTTHLQHRYADLNRQRRYEFWVTAFTRIGEGKSSTVAAISPATKLTSGIVSFGGTRVAGWKGDIILPCQTVGLPPPSRQWRRDGDTPVVPNPRTEIHPDGTLILHSLQRTDQGEYTCSVYNDQGNDRIAYQLVVQVPPSAPVLLMTGGSQDSLQLQWKIGDTGGTLVRGFVLHYKYEHGEWEELELEGGARTHSLAGLRCGTRYHVFITAYNRVGTSEPSATLNVRTRGAVPLSPPDAELLAVNFTSVGINFHSWPDGGCPLLYFVVEYSHYIPGKEDHWEVVGNNIRDTSVYPLVGLTPGQTYKLRITAHNSAGSTITKYKFKTLSDQVGAMGPSQEVSRNDHELNWNLRVLLLTVASLATACLSFFSVCFCWKKRAFLGGLITRATRGSRPTRSEPQEVMQMPVQEVRKEMTHNEEYYASVRKIPPSPETLECIPEYSDEIRPYATFHVPAPPKTESTKLQTFAYREREMSTRRSLRSEYRRSKRTRPTEEYDSFGSESDTEPGTSSRTESSNQLDYGRIPPEASRAYHPHAVRLPDIGLEEMYPPHEWCSPAEISPRTHRRSFVRRNYQAHMMK